MATFYVSQNGSDSASGAIGAPFRTTLRALNVAAVGDTIELRSTGGPIVESFYKNSRDTVTIQNFAGEDVIVETPATALSGYIWFFENARPGGILVRRNPLGGTLTFRNNPAPVVPSAGTFTSQGAAPAPGGKNWAGILNMYDPPPKASTVGATSTSLPALTVDGVIMTDLRGKGVFGYQTGIIVRNCDISHGSFLVYVHGNGYAANGVLIENNELHHADKLFQDWRYPPQGSGEGDDSGASAVAFDRHNSGAIVRNNTIHDNTCYSSRYVRDGSGIEFFRSSNWKIYDNTFWDNECVFETGTASGFGNLIGGEFVGNRCYGDVNTNANGPALLIRTGNGTKIYNNTFFMDGGGRFAGQSGLDPAEIIRIQSGTGGFGDIVSNLDIRNNIIVNTSTQNAPGNKIFQISGNPTFTAFDYNLIYSPFGNVTVIEYNGVNYTQTQLANWRANTPFGDNDIWNVVPALDAQNRPMPTSPAINAGVVIAPYTDGWLGTAPDLGYYETPDVPGSTVTYVTDTFSRSVTAGWASTENSLAYATAGGAAADYNVDGDEGTMSATTNREARLPTVSALDITGTGRVRVNHIPTGTGTATVYFNVRRVQTPATNYRFKIVFLVTAAGLRVAISKNDQGGAETTIVANTTPGAVGTAVANTWYRYRFVCWNKTVGVATLQMRLWPDGGSEPSTWDIDTTDSTTGPLQTAGHVSFYVYADAGLSNNPIVASFDDTNWTSPVVPFLESGDVVMAARSFMAVTGSAHQHGTPTIDAHARMLVTGHASYPAPPGRQTPPYLLPVALAGTPVGTWNQTDPDAVDDDPDNPDSGDYVGLTKGASGEIAWSFAGPSWTLDTTTNGQTFEVAMRNPSAVSQDFRVLLMELVSGVWTVKKTGTTQSLAGGASVMYLFTWTRSDLTDATGSNVACKVELL